MNDESAPAAAGPRSVHVSKLEDLVAGVIADGIEPGGPVTVVSAHRHGDQAITLTYRDAANQPREQLLYRSDEGTFAVREGTRRAWRFDGDGRLFRLAAEARRIHLAHLFDPYLALTSSEVDPLPHQIEAVYGEMLPRQPLRFLLADDPGAGKTIMAGLYIKELIIRGDADRILVVAPGSLVNQWQDELFDKFGLRFEIVTKDLIDSTHGGDVFHERDRLICRVDQIARREDLVERLSQTDWDLVVVDEAHRMSAHFFGAEVRKTKKYQLGETLGAAARHLLLMTATPHAGKEQDFQLFLALLDSDRFEGRFRDGVHTIDPSDLMRRMVKEKLLTFEGKPLFPERRATTVDYELSEDEMTLYDEVTEYVREQMNRADRLTAEGQGRRGNTVGFALTMLQRRLASSPEAIYQTLSRRRKRLESRIVEERQRARTSALGMTPQEERLSSLLADEVSGDGGFDLDAWNDLDGEEQEDLETEVVDAATAAATIAELEFEIHTLEQLEALARRLRGRGVDAKWVQLSGLLSTDKAMFGPDGSRRKLLIFTEHRDTMNYLVDRLRTFLGDAAAVECISGSTPREGRRRVQARFTQDESCLVLVATDAAGEGINLQRAHLVINYDLPWNPNRIEQRFGRVHRIGQTEVCHMWNLVASETREAQVYLRLLDKIDQQRGAYQGQVFDVLGEALSGADLRRLLIDAIRYGDDPAVRDRINQVIDDTVEVRIRDAIEHPPLAEETMAFGDVERIRLDMEEAAARRLQPHYIRAFFEAALEHLGGRLVEREPGRFRITTVPSSVRQRDRQIGTGAPVLTSYERITFDKESIRQAGAPPAEFLAPGHPLLTATIDIILERHRGLFTQGSVLVNDTDHGDEPRVLVMLEHSIADGRPTRTQPHTVVSRRFDFVEIDAAGRALAAGYAPYLDCRPPTDTEFAQVKPLLEAEWLDTDLEAVGTNHAISVAVPQHLAEVRHHTEHRVDATLAAVEERLNHEINYWDNRANELQVKASAGKTPQPNADRARQRADQLAERRQRRVGELRAERSLRALPPVVAGGALVIPAGLLRRLSGAASPQEFSIPYGNVNRRAIDAVLAVEKRLGWNAVDIGEEQGNHPGFDIRSRRAGRGDGVGGVKFITAKGRDAASTTVTLTRNELLTGLNTPEHFILALVDISPHGNNTVRYLRRPFDGRNEDSKFDTPSATFAWSALWNRARTPT